MGKYPKLYTKEELLVKGEQFFNSDKNRELMLATADGNFFYPEHRHYATAHVMENKELEIIELYKSDYDSKPKVVKKPKADNNIPEQKNKEPEKNK